ncbi:hypothetical protein B0H66DRAFT_527980 [Apodospora peruviana]|uniref:Uncharacterized protein n=1 Tax=Apodospora peruviana TaxID=516989 RepID=A0AAE0MGA1_9PEZI|nr:hypothetical protein B0H66DRAFT_527980 [Apodospora peruviana]
MSFVPDLGPLTPLQYDTYLHNMDRAGRFHTIVRYIPYWDYIYLPPAPSSSDSGSASTQWSRGGHDSGNEADHEGATQKAPDSRGSVYSSGSRKRSREEDDDNSNGEDGSSHSSKRSRLSTSSPEPETPQAYEFVQNDSDGSESTSSDRSWDKMSSGDLKSVKSIGGEERGRRDLFNPEECDWDDESYISEDSYAETVIEISEEESEEDSEGETLEETFEEQSDEQFEEGEGQTEEVQEDNESEWESEEDFEKEDLTATKLADSTFARMSSDEMDERVDNWAGEQLSRGLYPNLTYAPFSKED